MAGVVVSSSSFLESCAKSTTSPEGPTVDFTLDISISPNTVLNTVGGFLYSHGVVVIRSTDTVFTALSQACTHQGCTVAYSSGSQMLLCPCHGGAYNLAGGVVSGPPPAPLKSYTVTKAGNILSVKG